LRTLKLILEYNGSRYHGWQRQKNGTSIQAIVEQAFVTMCRHQIHVIGAGRTDAGVHAMGQVAHARVDVNIPDENFRLGLNSLLPDDIVIRRVETVGDDFHARFSATGKVYRYKILNRKEPSALEYPFSWHVPQPLDLEPISQALAFLEGTHDFSSFKGPKSKTDTAVRKLSKATVIRDGDFVVFEFEGDGFLRHMVRIIVGTAVEVGLHKLTVEDFQTILESKNRKKSGPTAPPQGLILVRVKYD
jgi:tRNA pseudouridine38-40 synthase